ncbi:YjeF N-terminal domain-containing protein [Syncephalastrum racemosum]|uniref:YjeF N-terminal domain-containing protein n=1 Tax=Syncephalastrum racemosum TaxID=13706 RepID=A0A1X2H625_SYNRA|nr:YjeF N-terminal domain-containing protein [Syncephalastrum racemosum]
MSPQREKKSNGKSDTKKQERNGKSKETKDSKEKPKAKEPKKAKQTKSESPTSKPDEAVLDQAATNTLTSMLQISPAQAKSAADISSEGSSPVSTQSSRKGSQGTFKVPSNLIPPMARGRAASSDTISTSSTRSSKDKLDLESQKEAKQLNKSPSPKQHTPKQEHKEEPKQQPKETKETKPATVSAKELDALVHPTSPLNIPDSNHEQDEDVEDGMPRIKVVSNGMRCPVVSADTMREVQEICISQTGPNEAMMVENAGHGASVMALKAIGGHRRIQPGNHNAAPVIVVLAGHTQVGLYALAAARHLANRTCHVYALVSPREPAEGSLEAIQRKCAEFSGVRIVHSVEDLPAEDTMPVDLIMDGLMGSETSIASLRKDYETRQLLWDAMDWANGNKAPILSLDFPSGINADDGL